MLTLTVRLLVLALYVNLVASVTYINPEIHVNIHEAIEVCREAGMYLAEINSETFSEIMRMKPKRMDVWVYVPRTDLVMKLTDNGLLYPTGYEHLYPICQTRRQPSIEGYTTDVSNIDSVRSSDYSLPNHRPTKPGWDFDAYYEAMCQGNYLIDIMENFFTIDLFGPGVCDEFMLINMGLNHGCNISLLDENGKNVCFPTSRSDFSGLGGLRGIKELWAINKPFFNVRDGKIYATKSVYNVNGELRAVLITKNFEEPPKIFRRQKS